MKDTEIKELLSKARTIAVLGAKDKAGQAVDEVGRYLIRAGYEVIPVHPVRKNVWGLTTYPSLADIPVPVDVVDVFRAPEFCLEHARETLALSPHPSLFWMQLGIRNAEATELLQQQNVAVVEDACLMVVHTRLFGKGKKA